MKKSEKESENTEKSSTFRKIPTNESEVQQLIQIEGMKFSSAMMRNNAGAFQDNTGRLVRYGLGNVSAKHWENWKTGDLVGITTIVITPDMIGKQIGVFTLVEVKEPAWNPDKKLDAHETAQKNCIEWVKARGGFAGFAHSVDRFMKIIGR